MKTESPDALIARLLEAERLADEAVAPDLARLLERPRRRREAETRAIRRIALCAAALAVVAALLVLRPAQPRGRTSEGAGIADLAPAAIQLAHWKAPTQALLRTSGADLWTRVPVLLPPEAAPETRLFSEPTKGVTP